MKRENKNYFNELNKKLDNLDKMSEVRREIYTDLIANKIAWCYKWKKITEQEKDILCDRVINYCTEETKE